MSTTAPMFLELEAEERERELANELANQEKEQVDDDLKFNSLGKRTLVAAENGRLMELAQLIAEDQNVVNYKDNDNYTPLHRASYGDHKDCAKYLLRHGANIEAKTKDEWTPLHCAVRWNNIRMAEFLIREGANINAKSEGGNSPLHIVASNGRYSITCDIIQMLLYHPNCDYTIVNHSGDSAFDIAKRSGPFYRFWRGVVTLRDDCIFPSEEESN